MGQGYEIDLADLRFKYDFQFDPVNEKTFENKVWPAGHVVAGEPVILRDYQVEIINKYLATPHCLQEIATGAGKTLITAA